MGFETLVRPVVAGAARTLDLSAATALGVMACREIREVVPRIDEVATYLDEGSKEPVTSVQMTLGTLSAEVKNEWLRRLRAPGSAGNQPSLASFAQSLMPGARLHHRLRDLATDFRIQVENRSEHSISLILGDVLSGGYADRAVARDVLIPPHAAVELDTFCIEGGRNQGARDLIDGGMMVAPSIRHAMLSAGQPGLWARVAEHLRAAGLPTPVASYRQLPQVEAVASALESFVALAPDTWVEDAVGLALRLDGRIAYADVFRSTTLFGRSAKRLIDSYLLELVVLAFSGYRGEYALEILPDAVEVSNLPRAEGATHTFFHAPGRPTP